MVFDNYEIEIEIENENEWNLWNSCNFKKGIWMRSILNQTLILNQNHPEPIHISNETDFELWRFEQMSSPNYHKS